MQNIAIFVSQRHIKKLKDTKVIMEIEKRKEIVKYLRRGDVMTIAKLAGVTRQTVERWIRGEVIKSTVEPYVVAFSKKRKKQVEKCIESEMQGA